VFKRITADQVNYITTWMKSYGTILAELKCFFAYEKQTIIVLIGQKFYCPVTEFPTLNYFITLLENKYPTVLVPLICGCTEIFGKD
jgi:hypothetical protein